MDEHRYGERSRGSAILSIGKVLFGTTALVVRLVPVHTFVFLLALHVFASAAFFRSGWRELGTFARQSIWAVVGVSIAFLVQDFAYYAAVKAMDVSVATLVRWVAPVFVVLTTFVIGERVTKRAVLAAFVAFSGLVVILAERGIAYGVANGVGITLALLSAVSVAGYWMGAKVVLRGMSANALLFLRSLIALPVLAIVVLTGFRSEFAAAAAFLPHLAGFGIVYGVLAAYLDTRGIQETSARQAAVLGYLVPLTTIVLSVVLLGEQITPLLVLGGVMILADGYLIRAPQQEAAK